MQDVGGEPGAAAAASLATLSPEDLLDRFVQGEDEAFTLLVERVGARLYGFLCRFLGDRHKAEDAYQTVLIKVAKHAHAYDRRARLTTWLYRIARNACVDRVRRDARTPTQSLDAGDDEKGPSGSDAVAAADPAPGAKLEAEELGACIAEAVAELPEEQREVFLLKEDGELTFDEIGELLGCGKETAKSRMRYALRRLQNALGKQGRLYGLLES